MFAGDIGTKSTQCPEVVLVRVASGDSVVVKNVAGDTLNTYTSLNGSASTLTAGNSSTFTIPVVYLQSAGRTSVSVTGGSY